MSGYKPRTSQIDRAKLTKEVTEKAHGPGVELLRDVLMDLDSAESFIKREGPCVHGVPKGCEVTCQSCGHTCKAHHHNGGYCGAEIGNGACGCYDYEGTEG